MLEKKAWDTNKAWNFKKVLKANSLLNDIANEILIQNLSPYERFLAAESWVTNFKYTSEREDEPHWVSRRAVEILNGNKIVCVGYASLLEILCKKIDIPCVQIMEGFTDVNHMKNLVKIDEKYNIHGVFVSDPTAVSKAGDKDYEKSYFHHLIPVNIKYNDGVILKEEPLKNVV